MKVIDLGQIKEMPFYRVGREILGFIAPWRCYRRNDTVSKQIWTFYLFNYNKGDPEQKVAFGGGFPLQNNFLLKKNEKDEGKEEEEAAIYGRAHIVEMVWMIQNSV